MNSSFLFTVCVAATCFFTLLGTLFFMRYRKSRFRENNETVNSSSVSPVPPPSCVSRNWVHTVFPSFHGEDVRTSLLTHILKEFKSKAIYPFIDEKMKRGKIIGPELKKAIQGSRIAVVLLSKNYASSSWCLDELVEIMKCQEELDQTVIPIFYEVNPSDVKKQRGDFGKVFKKTCEGKTNEVIEKWSQALSKVATITGYHSINWNDDAKMVEDITTEILNTLINSTPSRDFDGLVGMGAHMEKIEPLLRPDLKEEVRMIGIWGPPGIGKTTIARFLFHQLSSNNDNFQHTVFVENVKAMYTTIPVSSDDYNAKLHLQQSFLSKIIKKDIEIPHLGVAQDTLKDKKVLVVLDDVNRSVQLDAMAEETGWFGNGSRIIFTTQDRHLLKAHGINDLYEVGSPSTDEALQIFCTYAFRQKSPKAGFEDLSREVTKLAGDLPLGLKVMGSCLRGLSKEEWKNKLPSLRNNLHGDIESALKFSYDALRREDKNLFLHIACFFNHEKIEIVEHILARAFLNVRQGIHVLTEKSLISTNSEYVVMHDLLAQLGREIVRNVSTSEHLTREPGQRQFLVDARDICEVLSDDTAGTSSVVGINLKLSKAEERLHTSESAFERMTNLQFLRIGSGYNGLYFPQSLNSISRKIRLLEWNDFPMTCLPSNFSPQFLVKLCMQGSKLKKLWDGIQPLRNLKWMDLRSSKNLKKIPDLSTATNLTYLCLRGCSSLENLPSSIGNATNLLNLDLSDCTRLVNLPSSIWNAINLQTFDLKDCSSLVELPLSIGNAINLKSLNLGGCSSLKDLPSSIGNAPNLQNLYLDYCSSLVNLPSSIENAINLQVLDLKYCSSLVELPIFIGNATNLRYLDLSGCSSLVELPSSVGKLHKLPKLTMVGCSKLKVLPININMVSLRELDLTGCSSLKKFPEISTNIKHLHLIGTSIEEVPSSIKSWPHLEHLRMSYSQNLKKSPHALDTITELHITDTEILDIGSWVKELSHLGRLVLYGCKNLVSLPQLPGSLLDLDASNCESLERLDSSLHNLNSTTFRFINCFKLNQEAIHLISQTPCRLVAVLPGGEVPACFTYRAFGNFVTVELDGRSLPRSKKFRACILLDYQGDMKKPWAACSVTSEQTYTSCSAILRPVLSEHLYVFNVEAPDRVTSTELVFEFRVFRTNIFPTNTLKIKECGILQLLEEADDEHRQSFSSDDDDY
ncbi:unnamed protein product [Brassica rapa]|uniref:ADP-ribosyl cyclase/cyclic ADP-ribose hydrolase n=1 Tax=Brassica campestris TaxID=3711 RepID=A0A3P5Y4L5_BRACM|nr:unnamed protein product [Brassica rapa]VDC62309.1 unnamed protein product [Brassica rapa]